MPPPGDGQSSSGSPPSGGVQTAARSDSSTARRPFVPEAFGKYYLLDRVAVGGMAEVFRAGAKRSGGMPNDPKGPKRKFQPKKGATKNYDKGNKSN